MQLIYFASIRERLGCDQEQLGLPANVATVADLIEWLASERGGVWAEVLLGPRLLCAVNQEMCTLQQVLQDSDEVAFFPPVTGG